MKNISENTSIDVDKEANLTMHNSFSYLEQMQAAIMAHIIRLHEASKENNSDKNQLDIQDFCGKESAAVTLMKLCQLQQQLIKLTQELHKEAPTNEELSPMNEADWEMLGRAVEQRQQSMREVKGMNESPRKVRWLRSKWARAAAGA